MSDNRTAVILYRNLRVSLATVTRPDTDDLTRLAEGDRPPMHYCVDDMQALLLLSLADLRALIGRRQPDGILPIADMVLWYVDDDQAVRLRALQVERESAKAAQREQCRRESAAYEEHAQRMSEIDRNICIFRALDLF